MGTGQTPPCRLLRDLFSQQSNHPPHPFLRHLPPPPCQVRKTGWKCYFVLSQSLKIATAHLQQLLTLQIVQVTFCMFDVAKVYNLQFVTFCSGLGSRSTKESLISSQQHRKLSDFDMELPPLEVKTLLLCIDCMILSLLSFSMDLTWSFCLRETLRLLMRMISSPPHLLYDLPFTIKM